MYYSQTHQFRGKCHLIIHWLEGQMATFIRYKPSRIIKSSTQNQSQSSRSLFSSRVTLVDFLWTLSLTKDLVCLRMCLNLSIKYQGSPHSINQLEMKASTQETTVESKVNHQDRWWLSSRRRDSITQLVQIILQPMEDSTAVAVVITRMF